MQHRRRLKQVKDLKNDRKIHIHFECPISARDDVEALYCFANALFSMPFILSHSKLMYPVALFACVRSVMALIKLQKKEGTNDHKAIQIVNRGTLGSAAYG